MAGQIIAKGDNKWLVRVFRGRDSETGKKKYFSKQIYGTKKDAQKFLNKTLREIDLGTFVETTTLTVSEYLDQWLKTINSRVRERTYEWYKDLLGWYVRPIIGNKKLSDIRPFDIQLIYTNLQERGLSAKTIRHTHVTLSNAFKQAVSWQMIARNPCEPVKAPKVVRKEMNTLSQDEAEKFLVAARGDKWGIVLFIAITTAMRPSEYLALQWKDVDLEQGTISIKRSVHWRRGGGWYFADTKTSRSRRSLILPYSVIQMLREHKRKQLEERLQLGAAYQNNDLVFATSEGTPLMHRNLHRRHFQPTLKRAGLSEKIRIYDLRHTCSTLLLVAGENPKVISERLGHSSVAFTLDIYSHVLPSMQQAAADKLEKLFFSKSDTPATHQEEKGNLSVARK